ncbi:MAG: 3,4-dihydroxy 2-butanone 4-phosphate synthase/GTP cyclohydrolase II [Pseudoalteromonas tetraodonis]|jgi:3,4-dihydroxy 2-butanone 4-phosphate synthase/GTP cyclohydrolase II|uniref:3,4-dihydroxy-2-butanone 4-phosphate synthase n=4 Tax=Pseudoalteromonas TaxID=53246 RepID=A0AA37S7L6_9GAMM|nr:MULTISPECIES: bifunctional 3,4-dihydroxy-2-butanone-4-phosphate synthase/GTP cyclohydrolase II [Pseudoalteromonas]MAY57799.1 bifunctional 3,4-dihydroxy-2-butanone-4-phosphate synthase/GTP cyclohydrolase II [Pseudoalteromonas sp.]ADT67654.1 3,4-dihydroxy-2-butanone 4-phosphate synthase (DHBP synthase) [Pseudoalteromonas sp. SM9913]ALQ54034.1 3,4-dihydroxy-2-butanone 4-phosphate synthase [Pseudoalteromonas issachenkonii]ATC89814.1 3,4-dihydroxy 2-butanone 4-phosphate synthase / GTP cyclohydrol|tara:strand:+ start:239 stop:1351 length:1113 start_codon:yes stop_codon:yes gene_type:complete
MNLNSAQEIIDDIKAGKMVILMDDEDRENEGDLIIAAEHISAEAINFMATHGRGLICLTMTQERCSQLDLPLMVKNNGAAFSTNFTMSIEASKGVTTGISAADRARTVQAAIAKGAVPSDIVQPGHIFPIMAQPGGVLTRAGHTEAGCDLARLAGLEPSSVIVEILNEDGTMARRPDLEVFAKQHDIKIGTIADLIEYRNLNETTIEQVAKCKLPTEHGEFDLVTYKDTIDGQLHYALLKGEIKQQEPTLVRVHLQSTFNDILLSDRNADRSWGLSQAMAYIAEHNGALVILGKQESTEELEATVKAFAAADAGENVTPRKFQGTSRTVGVGSQILADLGIQKMRLMSLPKKYHALSGFHLEVVDYVEPQ